MGKVITIFLVILASIGIYSWLSGGALDEIKRTAALERNPISQFFTAQLGTPVETDPQKLAPQVPQVPGTSIRSSGQRVKDIEQAKQLGDPSPARGTVAFETGSTYSYEHASGAMNEYITLRASADNTSPVSLTGWSLQSAVTGKRANIGSGVQIFRMGDISSLTPITLEPNAGAIVVSGTSPLGVSFRTNICSGYLAQFQTFAPSLPRLCPTPSKELPNTLDNLRAYGESCIDFVQTLPSCTYHLGSFPTHISPACRTFVNEALTYNSCVERHQFDANFSSGSWRMYLGNQSELWSDAHDVIRLLDGQGRTVDVWSY